MIDRVARQRAKIYDRLREESERRQAEKDPQEDIKAVEEIPETVAVSDSTTATEIPAEDAALDWAGDTTWGVAEW